MVTAAIGLAAPRPDGWEAVVCWTAVLVAAVLCAALGAITGGRFMLLLYWAMLGGSFALVSTLNGDRATMVALMTHEQLGGPSVVWTFQFGRTDRRRSVVSHPD